MVYVVARTSYPHLAHASVIIGNNNAIPRGSVGCFGHSNRYQTQPNAKLAKKNNPKNIAAYVTLVATK